MTNARAPWPYLCALLIAASSAACSSRSLAPAAQCPAPDGSTKVTGAAGADAGQEVAVAPGAAGSGGSDAAADTTPDLGAAGAPVDAGMADHPPEKTSQLTCGCGDSTQVRLCGASCAPSDVTATCAHQCGAHGGAVVTSCVIHAFSCAPSVPTTGLVCSCGDGAEISACSPVDCGSTDARRAACTALCAEHGAPTGAACTSNPSCSGGTSRVDCTCNDSVNQVPIGVCAGVDCSNGQMQDAICQPICGSLGGLMATGCQENDSACQ